MMPDITIFRLKRIQEHWKELENLMKDKYPELASWKWKASYSEEYSPTYCFKARKNRIDFTFSKTYTEERHGTRSVWDFYMDSCCGNITNKSNEKLVDLLDEAIIAIKERVRAKISENEEFLGKLENTKPPF